MDGCFCRLYTSKVSHYTALQKVVKAISEETWATIDQTLIEFAKERKIECGLHLRADTTVTQTNIAYPVDARLLWDAIRVLTRLMQRIIAIDGQLTFGFANRTRMAKKLCYKIVMVKGRGADKKRKKLYRKLIRTANEVFEMGARCYDMVPTGYDLQLMALHEQLDHYLTLSAVAIDQCERRVLKGEKVPAKHKIVSLFEEHTDIICRGKSMSTTEFGHKVLFATGKSGLITQYQVLAGKPGDNELLPGLLRKHKRQFGEAPHMLCTDRRFYSADNKKQPTARASASVHRQAWLSKRPASPIGERTLVQGSATVPGRHLGHHLRVDAWFWAQTLLWKGWQSFKKYVALSVVTFNLRKIAALL